VTATYPAPIRKVHSPKKPSRTAAEEQIKTAHEDQMYVKSRSPAPTGVMLVTIHVPPGHDPNKGTGRTSLQNPCRHRRFCRACRRKSSSLGCGTTQSSRPAGSLWFTLISDGKYGSLYLAKLTFNIQNVKDATHTPTWRSVPLRDARAGGGLTPNAGSGSMFPEQEVRVRALERRGRTSWARRGESRILRSGGGGQTGAEGPIQGAAAIS